MATESEKLRAVRAQLRASKRPGQLQQRLTKVVQTGLVPWAVSVGLGAAAEKFGEDKGAIAVIAATAGGLIGQAILNPATGSVGDVLLSGAAGAGASHIGYEHGRQVARLHTAKTAMSAANMERETITDETDAETLDADNSQQRVMNHG